MSHFKEDLGKRIGIVSKILGGNTVVSHASGVTGMQIGRYIKGVNEPTAEILMKIAIAGNVNVDWLLTGEGPMHRDQPPPVALSDQDMELSGDFVMIPRYDVCAAAGYGTYIDLEIIIDHMAFRTDWVVNTMGLKSEKLVLISVRCDSMEPTLYDGDILLVDTSVITFKYFGRIHIVRTFDGLKVKRVQRTALGKVKLVSDNHRYGEEILEPYDADQIRVVGLVVWKGGRV